MPPRRASSSARRPHLLLVRFAALAALVAGCTPPPAEPAGPSEGTRAIAARYNLAIARSQRSHGNLAQAEQSLRRGLASAPDDAGLHRALAAVLIELGRSAEADPHQRRADAIDPPPPSPPDVPLARSSEAVLVVLVPPVLGERVPQNWPDDVVAATLERRLALRLPDAKLMHADPESAPAARAWLARFRPRAVLSLRVERAYCGESQKDGRFGMAWLRVAAEIPADRSGGATLVRTLVSEPRLAGGCLAEVAARALEQALELPLVESALARSDAAGTTGKPFTTAAIRTLFPGLGLRIEAQVRAGRSALASGQVGSAAADFERAARVDPEDPDVRAYLEETRATLALSKQIRGGRREASLDPRWSPSERAAADALLADERRRRNELLALLAVLDEDLHVPPAELLATLPLATVSKPAGFGPKHARALAGGEIETRGVYAPNGSILSRYYFARGAALPLLREEDTSHDGKPDRWIGYQDGTRHEIWEDGRGLGRPDMYLVFEAGGELLERIEIDDDGNGRPERVFGYTSGKLTRESLDTNHDGILDRFDHLDEDGDVAVREEDIDANGSIDVRSIYRGGRLVRRELATSTLDPG